MGPTWGPSGADRIQVGPMLAPWTLLSGECCETRENYSFTITYTIITMMKWYHIIMVSWVLCWPVGEILIPEMLQSLGMDKYFHPTLYNGCNYLSMMVLKLNRVSKRGPRTLAGIVNLMLVCCTCTSKELKRILCLAAYQTPCGNWLLIIEAFQ